VTNPCFRALLEPHYMGAYRFACYLTGDAQRAEDVLHEALVRAMRKFRQLKDSSRFRSWLFQIIGNVARNDGRSQRLRDALRRHLTLWRPNDQRPHLVADERQIIGRCLLDLPEEQREALVLYDFDGERVEAIARLQGVGEPTVRSRILYARRRFRALYSELAGDTAAEGEGESVGRRATP
jgi:RNA polymerase sigma-70 factor, ECF subfamily